MLSEKIVHLGLAAFCNRTKVGYCDTVLIVFLYVSTHFFNGHILRLADWRDGGESQPLIDKHKDLAEKLFAVALPACFGEIYDFFDLVYDLRAVFYRVDTERGGETTLTRPCR